MAYHYSANQYQAAYKPTVLRNWEVPKQYHDHPARRTGRTQIISNDKGHLLPGVPRSPHCPWGSFVGTWDLPRKIDRVTANELSGLNKIKPRYKQHAVVDGSKSTSAGTSENVAPKVAEKVKPQEQTIEEDRPAPYVPGDFTEDKFKLPSHEILTENRYETPNFRPSISKGYPKTRDDFSAPPIIPDSKIDRQDVEEFCAKVQEMKQTCPVHHANPKPPTPVRSAMKNFQLAKQLHKENLQHDPLPDMITHAKYCQLQMERSDKEPGLALNEENFATGIGWKGYPGYGPTKCTKLKVYRPKTCPAKASEKNDGRPSSVTSFDRKWRFIRQRKVTPIELAICWDMRPENPQDEPKRTPHIDGSNGSLAPAVFSLVHTPKDDEQEEEESSKGSGALFEKTVGERDFVLDRPKTACRKLSRDSSNKSCATSSSSKKRAKSALNLLEEDNCVQCVDERKVNYQSTPNLSECDCPKTMNARRLCMACEMKNVRLTDDKNKQTFKMAFKAGVPQKSNRKKDKRQDYPDHWRLATVYQHSYKPIQFRKRPLLATVFK